VDEEVLQAVERLPGDFREAVVLSDLEGLSYNEIADVMQVPIGTVKSRLYRGRRLLGRALHDYATEMGYIRGGRA
jgi:RNA polymerase sigma-70 factor (ECF subfamily)